MRALRLGRALFRVGLAEMVAYRAEVVLWILTATVPVLSLLVWDRAVDDGPVGRFDRAGLARYFTVGLIVRQLSAAWVVWDLNERIRTGALSPELLRPAHPLLRDVATNLAAVPTRSAVLVPLVAALLWYRPELLSATAADHPALVPIFLLSLLMSWAATFASQVAFGSLAFFTGQSGAMWQLWFGAWMLLSGYVVPVELLPARLASVVEVLPFRAALGAPTEIGAGLWSPAEAASLLALQAFWLFVWIGLASVAWTRGLRRYEAAGA